MSVISLQTFASFLGVDVSEPGLQTYLDRAESVTATKIGASTLERKTNVLEKTHYDLSGQTSGLTSKAGSLNRHMLQSGPAITLHSVKLNGQDITSDSTLSDTGWSVTFPSVFRKISFDPSTYSSSIFSGRFIADLEVTYDAGYTENDMPEPIKQYALTKASLFYAIPVMGVSRAVIGDSQVHLSIDMLEETEAELVQILSRYKRVL